MQRTSLVLIGLFGLAGCGFGQIGPETLIVAETPCGRVEYRSTKDQQAPGASCKVKSNGDAELTMGSDHAAGIGIIAKSMAEALMAGIQAAK